MLSAVIHTNRERQDLAGLWQFHTDPDRVGESERWFDPGAGSGWDLLFAPACWNEQRAEYDGYMGAAWYRRQVFIPGHWAGRRLRLTVQGALLSATVWINGVQVGQHEGGFTPFEMDVNGPLRCGQENTIVVRVDNTVSLETIPQGTGQNRLHIDWYNWGGLYRPIYLEAVAPLHLDDLTIRTLRATPEEAEVQIVGRIVGPGNGEAAAQLRLLDPSGQVVAQASPPSSPEGEGSRFEQRWTVTQPLLWTPDTPTLYTLQVDVIRGDDVTDQVRFACGLRTLEIRGHRFLMNGRPYFQKGISRVEDAPMQGRASWGPVVRRDYDLLKQCGANIYRPAGSFPSIEDVTLGDQLGICVILDLPTYGKSLPESLEDANNLARVVGWVREAVAVYKNHPSVVLWDLGTEMRAITQGARHYVQTLTDLIRGLDPTRPIFYIWHCLVYKEDQAQDIVDILCLWIGQRLHEDWEGGARLIDEQVEYMHRRYPDKPMIVYFGDVALAGMHSDPPRWYSEEHQEKYFAWAWEYAQTKPYIIGFWWWCLCDYRCRPSSSVNGLLRWGIHDRLRQPKLAARLIGQTFRAHPSLESEATDG